jgi:hypothetical protein
MSRVKMAIAAFLIGGLAVSCQEAATAPRRAGNTPRFATVADTGGGGGSGQFHFVANGDNGSVNWSGGDTLGGGGFTFGFLSVGRGGSTNNPQTFLSYFIEQCDPFFNCSFSEGFGQIPNRDLSGGMSAKQLHLNTSTTGNPNFFSFGPTGLIEVDWKANGIFKQSTSGTNQVSFPGLKELSQGNSSFASASATGSVVGVAISPFSGAQIGSNHNVTIDISH